MSICLAIVAAWVLSALDAPWWVWLLFVIGCLVEMFNA